MEDADARRVAARVRNVLEPPDPIVAELSDGRTYLYVAGAPDFARFHVPVAAVTSGMRAVLDELHLFDDAESADGREVPGAACAAASRTADARPPRLARPRSRGGHPSERGGPQ